MWNVVVRLVLYWYANQIPTFHAVKEVHEDTMAYESLNEHGEIELEAAVSFNDQEIQPSSTVWEHGDKDGDVALTRKTSEDRRTRLMDEAEYLESQHPETAANINTHYANQRETDFGDSDFSDGDNDESSESIDIDRIATEQVVHNANQTTHQEPPRREQQDEESSIALRMKRKRGSLRQPTNNSHTSDSAHESTSPGY